jgi:hypothetical protein
VTLTAQGHAEAAQRAAKTIADIKRVLALDMTQRRTALIWVAQHHPEAFAAAMAAAGKPREECDQ